MNRTVYFKVHSELFQGVDNHKLQVINMQLKKSNGNNFLKLQMYYTPVFCSLAAGLLGLPVPPLPNSLDINPLGCCSTCGVEAGVAGSDLLVTEEGTVPIAGSAAGLTEVRDLLVSVGLRPPTCRPGIGKAAGAISRQ